MKWKLEWILGAVAGGAVVVMAIATLVMGGGGASGGADSTRELAEQAIAAASAGSEEQALALAPIDAFDRVMKCDDAADGEQQKRELRKMITDGVREHAAHWKGVTATVVSVDPKGDPDVTRAKHHGGGNGCYNTADYTMQQLRVKLHASKSGEPAEDVSIDMMAMEIDGRWYTMGLPDAPAIGVRGKLDAAKQAMCSCKDQACVDDVHTRFGTTGDLLSGTAPPDDDTMAVLREIMECETAATIGP